MEKLVEQKSREFITAAQYAREALKKGAEYFSQKDYKNAFGWYQSALDFLPSGGHATAKLRTVAIHGFSRVAIAWAQQQIAEGRFQEAQCLLQILLKDQYCPNHPKALILLRKLNKDKCFNKMVTPDFLSRVKKVKQFLCEAEGFYNAGQYDLAFQRYEEILRFDKYNTAAREGQEKVEKARLYSAEEAYHERRAEMAAEVNQAWESPVKESHVGAADSLLGRSPLEVQELTIIQKKLDEIIIPQVNFQDAPLRAALQYIRQRAAALDIKEIDPNRKGVNIILKAPPESDQANIPITLQLTEVPLRHVLHYLMEGANMKLKVDPHAVLAVPLSESTEVLLTKEYQVPPSFISQSPGGNSSDEFVGDSSRMEGGHTLAMGSRPAIVARSGAKEFLEAQGITFPTGASANYLPSSSRLVVKNTQTNLDLIDALVEEAFSSQKQVRIEAKFLEITQNNAEELGFDWLLGQFRFPFGSGMYGSGGGGNGGMSRNGVAPPPQLSQDFPFRDQQGIPIGVSPNGGGRLTNRNRSGKLAIQLNAMDMLFAGGSGEALVTPGVLALAGIFTDPQFQLVIRALHQKKGVDLMTAPSVTTKSGHAARIQIVREFRYPTQFDPPQVPPTQTFGISPLTPATPSAFETKNTGIELDVTPTVGPDGQTIDLILQPKVTEFEGFINYGSQIDTVAPITSVLGLATGATATVKLSDNIIHQPVFSIREANTQVTINNGSTVALGGLIQEKIQKVQDKVPVLGDIPWVGRLFRSHVERRVKANLIMFVTANLIGPGGESGSERLCRPHKIEQLSEIRRAQLLSTEM